MKSANELNSSEYSNESVKLSTHLDLREAGLTEILYMYLELSKVLSSIDNHFRTHWTSSSELTLARLRTSVIRKREDIVKDMQTCIFLSNADEQAEIERMTKVIERKISELSNLKKSLWKKTAMNHQKGIQDYDEFIQNFIRNAEAYSTGLKEK